jgi:hypothetical protein
MRLHYCFNPATGAWFLGSFLLSPDAANKFITENKLDGFQSVGVDMLDVFWLKVKAAIDNRNMIAEREFQEKLLAEAKKATAALGTVVERKEGEAMEHNPEIIPPGKSQQELFDLLPDWAKEYPGITALLNTEKLTEVLVSAIRSVRHDSTAGKAVIDKELTILGAISEAQAAKVIEEANEKLAPPPVTTTPADLKAKLNLNKKK